MDPESLKLFIVKSEEENEQKRTSSETYTVLLETFDHPPIKEESNTSVGEGQGSAIKETVNSRKENRTRKGSISKVKRAASSSYTDENYNESSIRNAKETMEASSAKRKRKEPNVNSDVSLRKKGETTNGYKDHSASDSDSDLVVKLLNAIEDWKESANYTECEENLLQSSIKEEIISISAKTTTDSNLESSITKEKKKRGRPSKKKAEENETGNNENSKESAAAEKTKTTKGSVSKKKTKTSEETSKEKFEESAKEMKTKQGEVINAESDENSFQSPKTKNSTKGSTAKRKRIESDAESDELLIKKATNGKRKRATLVAESNESDATLKTNLLEKTDKPDNGLDKFKKYSKDKLWKLEKLPHHFLPSFNLSSCTDIKDLRDFPLLRVSLPHSVYVGSKLINDVDVCHRRMLALNSYMLHLKTSRTSYVTKKKSKQIRKDEKNNIYNRTLIRFMKLRDVHPDIYTGSDFYDIYYSGGNLCVNPDNTQILHVSGNNMERLIISDLNVEDDHLSVHQLAAVDLTQVGKHTSEIFEVQFSKLERNSFFVRQKYCISMHQYADDKFYALQNFRSKEVPFISFSQDIVNANHLAITNLEHLVRLYDVEKSILLRKIKPIAKGQIKPESNWNMIRSCDSNVYIYAASRRIDIIDTRIPDREWRSNYCAYEEDSYCSRFCSLAVSSFDNLFYVGSTHKVYCVDRRNMGKNIENKNTAVTRWTHQMSSYPLMMTTSQHKNCEYTALQSPVSADFRILENIQYTPESEIGTKYKSPCLPYMPPSLHSIFQEARKHGECIKPGSGIVDRLKACYTGLSFVGENSNTYILQATSNGDLFARHMYDGDNKTDQASAADVMSEYEGNIFRSVRKPRLQVTEVHDFSGISKVLRCPILNETPKPVEDKIAVANKRKYMGRWQKSIQTLYKYKDALAADLLSIWDVDPEEEKKDLNIHALGRGSVVDSTSLVSGWLEAAHSPIINMTSIPLDVFNASSAALETPLEETLQSNYTQISQDHTMSATKLKVSKKKSRYVKGF